MTVIQARTNSSRLPGKVMYPLDGEPAIKRVIERVQNSTTVDELCLAIPDSPRDDVLETVAQETDTTVHRGNEKDVLERTFAAADDAQADVIIRVAGDCPAVSPAVLDACVTKLVDHNVEYCSNKLTLTFPLGFDVEAFTAESFDRVNQSTTSEYHREHVTTYYLENQSEFSCINLESNEILTDPEHLDRTDIELVLDEAADYRLLRALYEYLPSSDAEIETIIGIIDDNNLKNFNESVIRTTEK